MKVYVVTSGCYSDYGIEAVFLDRTEAEKYCAVRFNDSPMIETYDTDENEKIKCGKVYKAFRFVFSRGRIMIHESEVMYSTKPINQEIHRDGLGRYIGYIPFEGVFDKGKFNKITSDEVAKFKAMEAEL